MIDASLHLSLLEARILGSLIEKEVTTPDQYPLSLNSLRLACNQKSNRDPPMEVTELEAQTAVDALMRRFLVVEASGSRVIRYRQGLCGAEHAKIITTPQERAILCELLVRGPQTTGELRTRGQRLAPFPSLGDADAALQSLMQREDGPFVVRLPRPPGSSAIRYGQLFTAEPEAAPAPAQVIQAIAPQHEHEIRELRESAASVAAPSVHAAPSVAAPLSVAAFVAEPHPVRAMPLSVVEAAPLPRQTGDAAADPLILSEAELDKGAAAAANHEARIVVLEQTIEKLHAQFAAVRKALGALAFLGATEEPSKFGPGAGPGA